MLSLLLSLLHCVEQATVAFVAGDNSAARRQGVPAAGPGEDTSAGDRHPEGPPSGQQKHQ